jgi:hypothetical protein
MARFALQTLVILILASVLELFLPWWSIAIAGAIGGYVFRSSLNFVAGFLSVAILWIGIAVVIDISASAPLADRVAAIFFSMPKAALFVITGVLGGLVTGFAAATGASLRREKRKMKYY